MRAYDVNGHEHRIDVKKEREHYTIEVDNHLYCSCDNMREVREEIPALVRMYKYVYVEEDAVHGRYSTQAKVGSQHRSS